MNCDAEAIRTVRLSKRYGDTLALDALDLAIVPGEVYGYLGPNGAGKTTTIRLLLGLPRPGRAGGAVRGSMPGGIASARTGALRTCRESRFCGRR
jgi:ABC-type multidrug transport system ATPase subunit